MSTLVVKYKWTSESLQIILLRGSEGNQKLFSVHFVVSSQIKEIGFAIFQDVKYANAFIYGNAPIFAKVSC